VPRKPLARSALAHRLFGKSLDRLSDEQLTELEQALGLDSADEDLYEQLAAEYPEDDGDATRH
jgi:succinate dehydrogenase flavin-adding protein (antitoxin of CptAB toxin-antitoxin module)